MNRGRKIRSIDLHDEVLPGGGSCRIAGFDGKFVAAGRGWQPREIPGGWIYARARGHRGSARAHDELIGDGGIFGVQRFGIIDVRKQRDAAQAVPCQRSSGEVRGGIQNTEILEIQRLDRDDSAARGFRPDFQAMSGDRERPARQRIHQRPGENGLAGRGDGGGDVLKAAAINARFQRRERGTSHDSDGDIVIAGAIVVLRIARVVAQASVQRGSPGEHGEIVGLDFRAVGLRHGVVEIEIEP